MQSGASRGFSPAKLLVRVADTSSRGEENRVTRAFGGHGVATFNTGTIVVVDDSESDLYIARRCAESAGIGEDLVALSTGDSLIEYLEEVQRGEKSMPSHVLLDLNLPGKDGFETLKIVRDNPSFATAPKIIILTNSSNPRDQQKAQEFGADDFVMKPSGLDAFIAFFRSLALQ